MITVFIRSRRDKNDFGSSRFMNQDWAEFYKLAYCRNVYLFGAGRSCREFIEEYGDSVHAEYILDNDESKIGSQIRGISIVSPMILRSVDPNSYVILITSVEYDDEIAEQLENLGANNIFSVYTLVSKENQKIRNRIHNFFYRYQDGLFCEQGVIYNYAWFHISAILRILRLPFAINPYKSIKRFKDIHKNERCFIVATGPSLRLEDIDLLDKNGEITFSVNSITKIYTKTKWRPDYYVIYDPLFKNDFDWKSDDFDFHKNFRKTAFLSWSYLRNATGLRDVEFFPISFLNHWRDKAGKHLVYSDNPIWGYYCSYTVVNICIQLAHYMGFSKVYLLGVDCDFNIPQKHFYVSRGDDGKLAQAKEYRDNMVRGYKFIGEHVSRKGTQVYNATRGGKLEVFPRVTLEDILN